MTTTNLLEIDPDKLFEKCSIEEIIEIDKKLQIEIEKKRSELKSMVGDRYRDIIAASDTIQTMKTTAYNIVERIDKLFEQFDGLKNSNENSNAIEIPMQADENELEKRAIAIQIKIVTILPEHIWTCLDEHDYSTAAQFFLLAQHIITGLLLDTKHNISQTMPIVLRYQYSNNKFRDIILNGLHKNLQKIDLSDKEASSYLNAFLLLEQKSSKELLKTFIELRKKALINVIESPHRSVRVQVIEMIKCLIKTLKLLHSCFLDYENSKEGLIWIQLKEVVGDSALMTISKVYMPPTPMLKYLPEIMMQYKPKYINSEKVLTVPEITAAVMEWLEWTTNAVKNGLDKSLELVTNVKALSIVREEALKIELPKNWTQLCSETNLPANFNAWNYFFQPSITQRAEQLISKQVNENLNNVQTEIHDILQGAINVEHFEGDIRWYTWNENQQDVSKDENKHVGLSMKSKGYTPNTVNLCEKTDQKFNDLLQDLSVYLYGNDAEKDWLKAKNFNKFIDKSQIIQCSDGQSLESHLRNECCKQLGMLVEFLFKEVNTETEKSHKVTKAIVCARFLQAVTLLCPNLSKCCSSGGKIEEWEKITNTFKQDSLKFWDFWLKFCLLESKELGSEFKSQLTLINFLNVLPRWEVIEIQEQTDERVFQTKIKIPSQPNLLLQKFLHLISKQLNLIIPHTLPKAVHLRFVESNVIILLEQYECIVAKDNLDNVNQTQALQFLLDVKFITLLAIQSDNNELVDRSRRICDILRSKIDPFDLDVFYEYLQSNVRRCIFNSQVILGCLLPSARQLVNLGLIDKQSEKEPSVLAISIPTNNTWFPLLPVTAPVQKTSALSTVNPLRSERSTAVKPTKVNKKTSNETTSSVRSGAAALFGAMTTDWFS